MSFPSRTRLAAIGRAIWHEWNEDRVAGLSAEIAFYGILSLFPALLAVAGFLGALQSVTGGDVADRAEDQVVGFLERILTDEANGTVEAVRQLFAESNPGVLTFGALTALWTLSRGFAAVIRALDVAYDVEAQDTRSWWRIRGIGLAMGLGTVVTSVVLLGMVVLGPLFGTGSDISEWLGAGTAFATWWDWFRAPIVALALVAWATTILHVGPAAHHTPWKWDLPGAFTTAVLAALASIGLRSYLSVASSGNQVFGVLGGALVVLLWLYLMGASLLLGAELNAVLAADWSAGVEGPTELGDEVTSIGDITAVEEQTHDG